MKTIFLIGLLIAAVSASPISDRVDKIEANLTHLWGMVHDMEHHHGGGVHIHVQSDKADGTHSHDTTHLDTDDNAAHVYLHMNMDMHDDFGDMFEVTEFSDMDHDSMEHGDFDDDNGHDPKMTGHGKGKHMKGPYHHHHHHHHHHHGDMLEAHCDLVSNKDGKTPMGHIHLKELHSRTLSVDVDFNCPSNISPGTKLGLHVHEGSDMSKNCDSLGGHFNPHGVNHGSRHSMVRHRHVGDWSNLICDSENKVDDKFYESLSTLSGSHSIMNRSIVIHAGTDDHGKGSNPKSKKTGDAGKRLACCIIKKKTDSEPH